MEPENGFDDHVKCCRQIVAPPHMPELMSNDSFELRIVEVLGHAFGPDENRPRQPEDSRLQSRLRQSHFDPGGDPNIALQPPQAFNLPTLGKGHSLFDLARDSAPAHEPHPKHRQNSTETNRSQDWPDDVEAARRSHRRACRSSNG